MEDSAGRSIDDDAPEGLRQEFIDLAFHVFERIRGYDEARLHRVITQSLGFAASGQPYGGIRYAAGHDINRADWTRVYDLICRLWSDLPSTSRSDYRTGIILFVRQ